MPIFDQRKCQARFIITGGFEWAARGGAKNSILHCLVPLFGSSIPVVEHTYK
jgi:hypothetical protein